MRTCASNRARALAMLVTAIAGLPIAAADPTPAEEAFQRGRELLKAGRTAEACVAFDASLAAEFEYGTLYNLAGCNEKIGKLATALAAYRRLATEDTNEGRRAKAAALASELDTRVGKLVVELEPRADKDIVLVIDGEPVKGAPGDELPLDAGRHEVRVRATGFREGMAIATMRDGDLVHVKVALDALAKSSSQPQPPPQPQPTRHDEVVSVHYTGHPTAGKILVGAGAGLIGVAIGVSLYEKTVYDRYVKNGQPVFVDPDPIGKANSAVHVANAMTYVGIGGVAAIVTGAVMWLTSEKVTTVRPVYSHDTVGLALDGRF